MSSENELACSFCGRVKPETQILVAGLDAHICEKCISQANNIIEEESNKTSPSEFSLELLEQSTNLPGSRFLSLILFLSNS